MGCLKYRLSFAPFFCDSGRKEKAPSTLRPLATLSAASILASRAFRVFQDWVTVMPSDGERALISEHVHPSGAARMLNWARFRY